MKNIIIDTNILLSFYRANTANYKKLLDFITDIQERIFIPTQLVDELNRNKAKVFIDSFNNYTKACNLENITVPTILDKSDEKINNWNNEYGKARKNIINLKHSLQNIQQDIFCEISKSQDMVSLKLDELFTSSVNASTDEIERARLRKLFGNPPGKPNDPIGDELVWEQFISYLKRNKNITDIFIISNDNDYFVNLNKSEAILNPKLINELNLALDRDVEVHCFKELSSFIKAFDELGPGYEKPSDEVLEVAKEEFILSNPPYSNSEIIFINDNIVRITCPFCNTISTYDTTHSTSDTVQFHCGNCNHFIDVPTRL